jgi:tetratricopeptide (TPR) repeat protein
MKPGRNDPCSCGSGEKYKNCCLGKSELRPSAPPPVELNQLVALSHAGRYAELESRARMLLGQYPDSGLIWKLLGESLYIQGKEALHAMQKATELLPDDSDAFNNLSIVQADIGRYNEAVSSCRRALAIKPNNAKAHYSLGNALKELGQPENAIDSYRSALKIKPDYAKAHSNLGGVLQELGQQHAAAEHFRQALKIDPKCIGAMLGTGQFCMVNGDVAGAEEQFRKALEIKPDSMDARFQLVQAKKVKVGDDNFAELVAMDAALRKANAPIPDKSATLLQFALGKCFDDIGDYDRAFPHFIEGCKLVRATLRYDAGQVSQYFNDIARVFDRAAIERLRGGGNASGLPIFVLGMPRSGTTLTEQIIASHPDVYGGGELPDFPEMTRYDIAGTGVIFPHNMLALDQRGLAILAEKYLAALRRHAPSSRHITDKTPANFCAIGLIHVMLPNAKIIHVNRNPVDTCLSCYTQLFMHGAQIQTYDLAELGQYYVDYARLMEHWRSVLPEGAFLDVRYEDIVADLEGQARRMIDFCGLDWNDACINFQQSKHSVRTASVAQVRQPIYKSSVERWRSYEKFLGPLLDALGDLAPR